MPQLLISNQTNPYLNIAIENYLLSVPSDEVTMYLWQNRRTVVIGQNQNPYAECDVDLLEREDGFVMRRRTGGGAVYHDLGNINFSFVVPPERYDLARQFSVLQRTVEAFGLEAETSGRNDLLCQGRKFSGNAFSRGRCHRLHHGTILIRTDVGQLQRYLRVKPAKLQKHGVESVRSRVVNLSELNPVITAQSIVPHLIESFEQVYGSPLTELDFAALAQLPEVQSLRDEFASEEWKYGRWRQFRAQRSAQFEWGGVELDLSVDQASQRIVDAAIASDSLFPDIVQQAEQMLRGASTLAAPALPSGLSDLAAQIVGDILALAYGGQ